MIELGSLQLIEALASNETTNVLLIVWLVINQRALRKIVDKLDLRLAQVETNGQENVERLIALETWRELRHGKTES